MGHLNTSLHISYQYVKNVFEVQVQTSSEPVLNLVELVQVGLVQVQVWFTPEVVGSGSGSGKMVSKPN